jgi:hypothetical protein
MSFQAYLDNIKAQTGKTPQDFAALAMKRGLKKHGDIVGWLKSEFALGHGHANAIAGVLFRSETRTATPEEKLDALFSGKKMAWRACADVLLQKVRRFGADVSTPANETYVSLLRGKKKFGILQPASGERFDIGIKRKGVRAGGRFEAAGSWNAMVTHRLRIADPRSVDAEVVSWLKQAYEAAD